MGRAQELYIEHRWKGRMVQAKKLRPGRHPFVMGSSPLANIRLLGGNADGIHAAVEYEDGVWNVYDLGSPEGTTVNGKSFVNYKINQPVVVKIGSHELRVRPLSVDRPLFETDSGSAGVGAHQQIVVKKGGQVLETHFLNAADTFQLKVGSDVHNIPAATKGTWEKAAIGSVTVMKRLVALPETAPVKIVDVDFNEAKLPAAITLGMFFLFFVVGFLMGRPTDKPAENQVTKMIFDAKVMTQKKEKSLQTSEKKFAKAMSGGPAKAPQSNQPKPSVAATKVISSIKASGLERLVGKIAARTSVTANVIAVASKGAAEAKPGQIAYASDSLVKDKNVGTNNGSGYKVGKVATDGKGGGGTGYAQGAGMASGNVAIGEVGTIEEESIVDGGLDPEVIASYIRNKLGEIRYCYERQLSAQPDLYGKVQVKFVIGADGAVTGQSIGNSTLKSANVEGCILRRVAGWKFPNPKGGTSVYVTYPFLFKATN